MADRRLKRRSADQRNWGYRICATSSSGCGCGLRSGKEADGDDLSVESKHGNDRLTVNESIELPPAPVLDMLEFCVKSERGLTCVRVHPITVAAAAPEYVLDFLRYLFIGNRPRT